eukprot:scaffold98637_cov52-Phaeocystis_antarctica.AAC.1
MAAHPRARHPPARLRRAAPPAPRLLRCRAQHRPRQRDVGGAGARGLHGGRRGRVGGNDGRAAAQDARGERGTPKATTSAAGTCSA